MAVLFDGVAKPLGRPAMSAVWLAGRRLVTIDGSWLVAADAVKNPIFFLEPGVNNSEKPAFRQRILPTISSDTRAWEYGHVLSGKLDVQVMFETGTLEHGDSVNFESSPPHRLSNPYDEECVAIWSS